MTARGRLSCAVSERVLGCATAGLAFGEIDESVVSDARAVASTSGGEGRDVGCAVGAGVEAKVTERVSVGIEDLHTDLGESDHEVSLCGAPGTGHGNAFSSISDSTDARGSEEGFDVSTLQVKLSCRS